MFNVKFNLDSVRDLIEKAFLKPEGEALVLLSGGASGTATLSLANARTNAFYQDVNGIASMESDSIEKLEGAELIAPEDILSAIHKADERGGGRVDGSLNITVTPEDLQVGVTVRSGPRPR